MILQDPTRQSAVAQTDNPMPTMGSGPMQPSPTGTSSAPQQSAGPMAAPSSPGVLPGASVSPSNAMGVLSGPAMPQLPASSERFDFNAAAGEMKGPTTYQPSSGSMVSEQLNKLLAKNSPTIQLAKTRALQQANRAGLANSSMAAGAGVLAAVQSALPIAQQDANTTFTSERDNNQTVNTFNRDSNQFGRDAAQLRFRGVLDRESQERDQTFRAGESALERQFRTSERLGSQDFQAGENALQRSFQTGERIADQDFRSVQAALDREQQLRVEQLQQGGMDRRQAEDIAARERSQRADQVFSAEQRAMDRSFQSGENRLDREFRTQQDTIAFSRELERMGFANNLANSNLPIQFAMTTAANMQVQIGEIMANPELSPEAKENAVRNLVGYANASMGWAEMFFGNTFSRFSTSDRPPPTGFVGPATPTLPGPARDLAPVLSPGAPAPSPVSERFPGPVTAVNEAGQPIDGGFGGGRLTTDDWMNYNQN